MSHKQDALENIVALAQQHDITAEEIAAALQIPAQQEQQQSSTVLSKLLGYIGGIFVFAGIGTFIGMYWDDFGSAARVIVTLGVGFVAFVMALVCLTDERYQRVATPLNLIAIFLQPMGIFVMLDEYSSGGDERLGVLFMAGYMLLQQGFAFIAKERTIMAFAALCFGAVFFATLLNYWDIDNNLNGMITGVCLLCITYGINNTRHQAIAPLWFFIGAMSLLVSLFDFVEGSPLELAYLGVCAYLIYLSTTARSRTLLFVSTIGMLCYIGYFTAEHFADTLGWPIALVIIGVALIGLSALAVRLNNKYIKAVR